MRRALFFTFLFLSTFFTLQAQTNHNYCGNGHNAEWDDILTGRLLRNKQLLEDNPLQFRSTVYVPVTFHMVANGAGFGRVSHAQVLNQLCKLNQDFADMDMQFYIKALNDNINNNGIYTTQYSAGLIMNVLRDNAAMNVWIVDVAAGSPPSPNDPPGTVLGYYSPQRDWMVIRRSETNANSVTLPHEVGHFFSLKHTHNGWDNTPWSPAIGNPAPAMSPGGVPTERQDGSNCQTGGDFICDTPPDYNGLGFNGCNYNVAQDPTGVLINPDEQLFMSYFLNCTRDDYYFSQTQQDLMWMDYNHSSRNYLRPNTTPNLTEITAAPNLIFPINNEFTPGYNSVTFQWSSVAGADFHLLEIAENQQFSSNPVTIVVSGGASHTVNTLQPNKTYFWRVRPYNAYRTCAPFTTAQSFRTNNMTVSTREIAGLNSWTVSPNPVVTQGTLQVDLQAGRGFEGMFSLYNPAGQLVQHLGRHRINSGSSSFEFSVEGLQAGIYILALDQEEGREVRRVVVTR